VVKAIFDVAKQETKKSKLASLTIKLNHKINYFSDVKNDNINNWILQCDQQTFTHQALILATAMDTLTFKQCEAIPPFSRTRTSHSH